MKQQGSIPSSQRAQQAAGNLRCDDLLLLLLQLWQLRAARPMPTAPCRHCHQAVPIRLSLAPKIPPGWDEGRLAARSDPCASQITGTGVCVRHQVWGKPTKEQNPAGGAGEEVGTGSPRGGQGRGQGDGKRRLVSLSGRIIKSIIKVLLNRLSAELIMGERTPGARDVPCAPFVSLSTTARTGPPPRAGDRVRARPPVVPPLCPIHPGPRSPSRVGGQSL